MSARDGGPAFPVHHWSEWGQPPNGMSLRDWFAGQALAGILGNQNAPAHLAEVSESEDMVLEDVAGLAAYRFADAMLAARNAEEESGD